MRAIKLFGMNSTYGVGVHSPVYVIRTEVILQFSSQETGALDAAERV